MESTEIIARLLKSIWVNNGIDSPVCYTSINVGSLSTLKVDNVADKIEFEALAVDNEKLKSHAGIFISVNGQKIVGGYPFESLELQRGKSVDDVLLDIRKSLARLASQKIRYLEDKNSPSS